MEKKEIRHPDKSVHTGAYSAGVSIDNWLYVSGQGPLDLETGEVLHASIEEETLLTLRHISRIVEAAGGQVKDIVKCTVHLSDISHFQRFDRAYASFFSDTKPARTTVQSVLSDGIKVEIDAVAWIPSTNNSNKD